MELRTSRAGGPGGQPGQEEFDQLRAHVPGESLGRISWAHLARGQGLWSKQFIDPETRQDWVDYQAMPGPGHEQKLAQMAHWIDQYAQAGLGYGVRLPGQVLPVGGGPQHQQQAGGGAVGDRRGEVLVFGGGAAPGGIRHRPDRVAGVFRAVRAAGLHGVVRVGRHHHAVTDGDRSRHVLLDGDPGLVQSHNRCHRTHGDDERRGQRDELVPGHRKRLTDRAPAVPIFTAVYTCADMPTGSDTQTSDECHTGECIGGGSK